VIGYDMPVVSGLIRTQERAVMSMAAPTYGEIEAKLKTRHGSPIPPKRVNASTPAK